MSGIEYRLDLAEEFRRNPYGRHSGELQRILNLFRAGPTAGKYVLVRESRGWPLKLKLACFGTTPHDSFTFTGDEFDSYAEAEWAVFRLRWKDHAGQDLPL
ncbi:MAG TPA: hypothetical protein VM659_10700 [Dongiaceae bacterium]|nr:hypothetical protein [Dongiaceae bacterium]